MNYAESLVQKDGWWIVYLSKNDIDPEDREFVGPTFAAMTITASLKNLDTDPSQRVLLASLFGVGRKYALVVREAGTHIANLSEQMVYEAHWKAINDAVYTNDQDILGFLGEYGFLVFPPQN